jgi:hypothetical protein
MMRKRRNIGAKSSWVALAGPVCAAVVHEDQLRRAGTQDARRQGVLQVARTVGNARSLVEGWDDDRQAGKFTRHAAGNAGLQAIPDPPHAMTPAIAGLVTSEVSSSFALPFARHSLHRNSLQASESTHTLEVC